jgi:hypothetical protein
LEVLEEASTPSQRAFAYGYLSHLAADGIAHNHYIPEQIIRTYSTKTLRHIYWEVRFDTSVKREYWSLAKDIASISYPENDELLEKVVRRTLFSFKTDKRIFHSILMLNRMKQWQKMLVNLSEKSQWKLLMKDVEHYNKLSLRLSLDFLLNQDHASCLQVDPVGRDALRSAKWVRKNLAMLNRRGRLTPEFCAQVLKSFRSGNLISFSDNVHTTYLE